MNSKNDGPDKTSPRPADQSAASSSSGPKKPYATLDLKATEVKDAGKPAEAAAKGEAPKADPSQASEKPRRGRADRRAAEAGRDEAAGRQAR